MSHKVWFITGCSSGFGRALAEKVLSSGDKVVVTARKLSSIIDFEKRYPEAALILSLDVTNQKQIHAVVDEATKLFGRIDVLVNNAGYGILGAVEEVPADEGLKLFETNFFGLWEVTRSVLPIMRKQKSGHIINISSVAGITGMAGSGLYNATKFAVEGLSEALAQEVASLGVKVTLIEPGPFRTDFAGRSLKSFSSINDYDATRGVTVKTIENYDGKQPGDPDKAAEAIYMLVHIKKPPLHLPLGRIAVERIRLKLSDLSEEVSGWEKVAIDTDYKS